MPPNIRQTRPPLRQTPTAHRVSHPTAIPKPITRADIRVPGRELTAEAFRSSPRYEASPNPYLDYGRFLTPQGGILIVYKDLDMPFWRTLWRFVLWVAFTGAEGWYLFSQQPFTPGWNVACLCALAIINWLFLLMPSEVSRTIEIRPDCMIIDGADIFWRRYMESWPAFQPNEEGHQVLCGIYGTRFVEYLTVRRFDELDRAPEVFAAHLQEAMQQLWTKPRD